MDKVKMVYSGSVKPWWMAASSTMDSADGRGVYSGMDAMTSTQRDAPVGPRQVQGREAAGRLLLQTRKSWVRECPREMFLVHTQTGTITRRCGTRYQEYQPSEASKYLDRFVAETWPITRPGSSAGTKVWLLAQTPSLLDHAAVGADGGSTFRFLMSSLDFTGAGSNVLCRLACASYAPTPSGWPATVRHHRHIQHKGGHGGEVRGEVRDVFVHMFEDAEKEADRGSASRKRADEATR